MGKNKRLPSPPTTVRALKPGQTVHLDLWGPSPVASRGGKRYFLTCYDDNSRRKIIYLLKGKSETTACVIEYVKLVENQLGTTVKLARSDLGGEFEAGKLDTYFKSKGIEHHQIPPTAHAQNGRVERAHLTIANDMRTLLVDSKLGPEFWADAATYAVYTRNRIPGKDQKESPEAIWYGRPPKMDHLQPFGADAFYRDYRVKGKLAARGRKARLLGYQPGTSYYRLLDVITTKTVQSRDVTFTEGGRSPSTPITPTTPLLPRKPTVQNQWSRITRTMLRRTKRKRNPALVNDRPSNPQFTDHQRFTIPDGHTRKTLDTTGKQHPAQNSLMAKTSQRTIHQLGLDAVGGNTECRHDMPESHTSLLSPLASEPPVTLRPIKRQGSRTNGNTGIRQ